MRDLVMKQQTVQYWGAWIGLHRKTDTKFYWIDGTPLEGQYSAWASGEPSNSKEECVHIYASGQKTGLWNDIKCVFTPQSLSVAPFILCQRQYI